MNKPQLLANEDDRDRRPVFLSFATADRKAALSVCTEIERRGTRCWIASRDVRPGENYQEAIVRAIRKARAVVLVFSEAANDSDEIKKELSLASRYRVPVMALRIEDVEPSDAFAYELSTRQWIDAFKGWDKSIDALVDTLGQNSAAGGADGSPGRAAGGVHHRRRVRPSHRRLLAVAAFALALGLGVAGAAWLLLRPSPVAAHSTMIRLAGFQRLSPDLPAAMSDAVGDEFVSAFPRDGEVTVSTAAAPPGGGRGYAIGGTLRREGDKVRAIARLTEERSGATIWSKSFEFPAASLDKVPHWFAVNAASVVNCGFSGAATYPKQLPRTTLVLFFSVCSGDSGAERFDAARRVVKATPDFSAGWSALAGAAILYAQASILQRPALREQAWEAAEKAIRLDPENGDAYVEQSLLLPRGDLIRREALLKGALASAHQPCACEHHFYGWFLWEVGKIGDARQELFRAVSQDPFAVQTRINYAETLLLQGFSRADAEEQYKIAADVEWEADVLDTQKLWSAPITGDYATALETLESGRLEWLPPDYNAALIASYKALISDNLATRRNAAAMLQGIAEDHKDYLVVLMLGALGANQAALEQMRKWDSTGSTLRARLFLWYPTMRGVISDPGFPAVAEQMGLMKYWRTTHTRPDVCSGPAAPAFCRMI